MFIYNYLILYNIILTHSVHILFFMTGKGHNKIKDVFLIYKFVFLARAK